MHSTEELARRHCASLDEVNAYRAIAPKLTEEACKLRDVGFAHGLVRASLRQSNATTALGLARWIATSMYGFSSTEIAYTPWLMRQLKSLNDM